MPATYYIWKWADNNLAGKPVDIVSQLCAGVSPKALQQFSHGDTLRRLAEVADQRRTEMSELLIEPQAGADEQVPFIHVTDAASDSAWLADKLLWAIWPMGLTLYDEGHNRLLGLPKRNVVESPADGRQFLDIEPGEIPELLRTLDRRWHLSALACYDRNGNMFQVWTHQHRFAVEWQVMPERDFNKHRIWVAGKPSANQRHSRLGTSNQGLDLFANEVLTMADAQRLWVRFLAGAERSESYLWRDITQELNKPGRTPRCRYQQKDKEPPP